MSMKRLTKYEITKRLGHSPEELEFKGQCYDAGPGNFHRCALTGSRVRYCFTLKPLSGVGRITVGVGSFLHLRRWNSELYIKLVKGREWLMIMVAAENRDLRKGKIRSTRQTTEATFKSLRITAKERIRRYQGETGKEWMPESMFNLKQIVSRSKPMFKQEYLQVRWLGKQVADLEAALELTREMEIIPTSLTR